MASHRRRSSVLPSRTSPSRIVIPCRTNSKLLKILFIVLFFLLIYFSASLIFTLYFEGPHQIFPFNPHNILSPQTKTQPTLLPATSTPSTPPKDHKISIRPSHETIHIVLNGDAEYSIGLLAVMNSTMHTCSEPYRLLFHVVTTDEENRASLDTLFQRLFPAQLNYHIMIFDSSLVTVNPTVWNEYRRESLHKPIVYARFFFPTMFPEIDRVLYLDNDVIVKKNIVDLWGIYIGEYPIAAARLCRPSALFRKQFNYEHSELQQFNTDECSFNNGVLIYNLKQWRAAKTDYTKQLLGWTAINSVKKLWGLGSQPPFNLVFYRNYYVLDDAWNLMDISGLADITGRYITRTKEEVENAAILHWNGEYKPWHRPGPSREYWLPFLPVHPEPGKSYNHEISGNTLITAEPRGNEKFTVVIVSHRRSDTLPAVIQNVRKSPHLQEVVIVWNNLQEGCPSYTVNHHQVRCIPQAENLVHNRFLVHPYITTNAVFHHDDDTIVPLRDMELGFRTWRLFPDSIVGYEPRRIVCNSQQNSLPSDCSYSFLLEEGWFHIVIGKLFFIHKKYMSAYETFQNGVLKAYTSTFEHPCEDIAMNFLAGHLSNSFPLWVKGNQREIKSKRYSGLSTEHDTNIWKRKRHSCLSDLIQIFQRQPILPSTTKAVDFRALEASIFFEKIKLGESWCSDENGGRPCRQT